MPKLSKGRDGRRLKAGTPRKGPFATKVKNPKLLAGLWREIEERQRRRVAGRRR